MGKDLHEQNSWLAFACAVLISKGRAILWIPARDFPDLLSPKHSTGVSSGAEKVTENMAHISPIGLCCVPKYLHKASCSSAFQGRRGFTDTWDLCHYCQQAWQYPSLYLRESFQKGIRGAFPTLLYTTKPNLKNHKTWCCRLRPPQSKILE